MDGIHQYGYGDYLYQVGLVDVNGRQKLQEKENTYVVYIKNKQWKEACELDRKLLFTNNSFYTNLTGLQGSHNFLQAFQSKSIYNTIETFLNSATARHYLHIGNITLKLFSNKVYSDFCEDDPKSVALWISKLLDNYPVLFYAGQTDIVCTYPLMVNTIRNLRFNGSECYKTAIRHKWYVDGDLVGYVKRCKKLIEILVRNANHAVHVMQPKVTFDIITRFTHNLPFY
ncbi:hypothetical protein ILUMI_15859 [Ignelater luminosus]|uniref:Serine carboxypeptidase n=1 Tax=Ignelater luminosus TaxID=2038154 RepID=A0A8K0CPN4_IGNLU|nr:hypothetical protein ILUMI_15859 [Ignelater luminosus]